MHQANRIMGDVKERIGVTSNARGLGATIADQINAGWERFQVLRIADVSVNKFDPMAAEIWKVDLAAAPDQIVCGDNAVTALLKMKGHLRARETAAAGDEDLHGAFISLSVEARGLAAELK